MTHFSGDVDQQGPILNVLILTSGPRTDALKAAEKPVPMPVPAKLLIDTGASKSCICLNVVEKLEITPTGSVSVLTPSTGATPHSTPTYDIGMFFQGLTPQDVHGIATISVTCNDFSAQGIDGLLGRDVLSKGRLFYDGRQGMYFLSF